MPTVHVTNGSCAGDTLQTFVDGPVVITADVLHDGPAPAVDDDEWYAVRSRQLSTLGPFDADQVRADLARSDRAIADAVTHGDGIVLWFEHDLFDQLLLIRVLARIAAAMDAVPADGRGTVSLICIDRFAGVERFIGLGQLDRAQLESLYPSRAPVTPRQFALAAAAWDAFRAPTPEPLMEIAASLSSPGAGAALPFLGAALLRFFAEYPAAANGLTRTEALALEALAREPAAMGPLFAATSAREPSPFMGDLSFVEIVDALATARAPLVAIDPASRRATWRDWRIDITDAGRAVLANRLDRIALNGIDLWRGGVHLSGDRPWRWDAARQSLLS